MALKGAEAPGAHLPRGGGGAGGALQDPPTHKVTFHLQRENALAPSGIHPLPPTGDTG